MSSIVNNNEPMVNANGGASNIVPVTYKDALIAQGKHVTPRELFAMAYEWGNQQAIPDKALRGFWPEMSVTDDKVTQYLDNVYFVQYCALQYWEKADNATEAETWRSKGMDTWGKILDAVGCTNKRHNTDWLYLVSRATIDGKPKDGGSNKVVKDTPQKAYRKRVELLIGMAINGFVFVNPRESLESVKGKRQAKADAAAAKEATASTAEQANTEAKAPAKEAKKTKVSCAATDEPTLAKEEAAPDVMPTVEEAAEQIAAHVAQAV